MNPPAGGRYAPPSVPTEAARRHISFASVFVIPEIDGRIKMITRPEDLRVVDRQPLGAGLSGWTVKSRPLAKLIEMANFLGPNSISILRRAGVVPPGGAHRVRFTR